MKKAIMIFTFLPLLTVCFGQNEVFEKFLYKFANDSIFQLSRVEFPLKYFFTNNDTFEDDSTFIMKKDYKFDRLQYSNLDCTDAYSLIYDNFDCKFGDTNERVFRWVGFTDMDMRYYFKRKQGKWYLIKIENW
jgi:hypothetical protein